MQKPVITIALAYIAGLVLGRGFLYFPYSIGIIFLLAILTAGLFAWSGRGTIHRPRSARYFLMAVSCIIGMGAYIYSATWLAPDHYTRLFTFDKAQHELTGVITSPLDRDPDRTAFVVRASDIDGTPVSGNIRVSVREASTTAGYGDLIQVKGSLLGPLGFNNPGGFDYAEYLAQKNVFCTMSVRDSSKIRVVKKGGGILRALQDWRELIRGSFLASTSGDGAAILQAMVIGEEGGITEDLRDRFMAAGVTHIISISGSHLGMVAVLCFGLLRSLMFMMPEPWYHRLTLYADPRKIAAGLTLPLVVFYTLLAGGQVATIRSLIMITAGLSALMLDRENALMHSLALAAFFILVVSPQAIFDISFQLSYLSVLVIGYVVSIWNDVGSKTQGLVRRLGNSALLLIIISFATCLATGPLVAHYFNQFSLAGLVSNLVVVPFAGMVVVPLGLFSGIVSLFTHHLLLAALNQTVSDAFVNTVFFFSRLPFAEFHPPSPNVPWLLCYAVFLFSLATVIRARLLARFKPLESSSRISKTPVIMAALSGTFLALSMSFFFIPKQRTEISFPDVGQGDCSLIELKSGKTVLIDGGGTRDNRFDIGRRVLAPYLWNKGVRAIDLLVLSHPHPDHMNGLKYIVKKFSVAEVWESGLDTDLPGYDEFGSILTDNNILRKTVSAEDVPRKVGEAELRILHPFRGYYAHDRRAYAAENDRSLVLRMALDGRVFLFAGDIHSGAERSLLGAGQDLACGLLKVPHHGSKTSSSETFVAATHPELAIVTCGKSNRYGHPSAEVTARYEKYGAKLARTDLDGAVTVRIWKNSLDLIRWSDMTLKRIDFREHGSWGARERENARRLWKRSTMFF